MDRLINRIIAFVVLGLIITTSTLKAQTEYFNIYAQMPWPEEESLQEILEDVWATYPHTKWIGPYPNLVQGQVDQWDRYRDAVIYILENDKELSSHGYIMVYYLKRLSDEAWQDIGYPQVEQFLKKTEGREELKQARNQAFETLFFRGTEQQIGEYLRKPADRKLVQDYLTSIWTRGALLEINSFLKEIEEKVENNKDLLKVKKELEESISTIEERQMYATLPREEIPQDYFGKEGKRQYETAYNFIRGCERRNSPDYCDGVIHVNRYWSKYRLGAFYFLEKIPGCERNFLFIGGVICPNNTKETTYILKKLIEKCELNPKIYGKMREKAAIMTCYINRVDVDELNRKYQKYLFDRLSFLHVPLSNRYGEIGNEESLEILRTAKKYWREQEIYEKEIIDSIERGIDCIENRLGKVSILQEKKLKQTKR